MPLRDAWRSFGMDVHEKPAFLACECGAQKNAALKTRAAVATSCRVLCGMQREELPEIAQQLLFLVGLA